MERSSVRAEDLFHTGIVVDDVESTLRWFTDTAGYQWCRELAGEHEVQTAHGRQVVPLRVVYSMNEPRLEIVQAVPDTLWVPADAGVHHIGYWVDDVDEGVARLVANGLHVEVTALSAVGPPLWAYCKGSSGLRIELVSRSVEPAMREWFADGGSFFYAR
jgi:catechol 2,3-dioxygenase-like lactoylglutathione lyase family enzyme